VCQLRIPPGERSGLLTRIATTESVSLCMRIEKLTAFLDFGISDPLLAERPENSGAREIKFDKLSQIT
jgi:hypothetical protein